MYIHTYICGICDICVGKVICSILCECISFILHFLFALSHCCAVARHSPAHPHVLSCSQALVWVDIRPSELRRTQSCAANGNHSAPWKCRTSLPASRQHTHIHYHFSCIVNSCNIMALFAARSLACIMHFISFYALKCKCQLPLCCESLQSRLCVAPPTARVTLHHIIQQICVYAFVFVFILLFSTYLRLTLVSHTHTYIHTQPHMHFYSPLSYIQIHLLYV